jgi:hypothetical protein
MFFFIVYNEHKSYDQNKRYCSHTTSPLQAAQLTSIIMPFICFKLSKDMYI